MKQILLATALCMALAAPALAQDAGNAQQQAGADGQPAKAPAGDLFLRSGDPAQAGGGAYLRGGPINMTPGAVVPQAQIANQAAAAQVYDPEAPKPGAVYAPVAIEPDYSATSYNRGQSGVVTPTQSASGIKSPFPSWFGGYKPPTLGEVRKNAAAQRNYYAQKDRAEAQQRQLAAQQQAQPKRTTAFGTTSEIKARQ